MMRKMLFAALVAVTALSTSGASVQAQGACLTPQQHNQAVTAGQILSLPDILRVAGIPKDQVREPVQVCDQGGQLYYSIPVDRGASYENVVLNARTGQR